MVAHIEDISREEHAGDRQFDESYEDFLLVLQSCPVCQNKISAFPGSKGAICTICGFKDPCCE